MCLLLDGDSKLDCAEVRIRRMQANVAGAWASTPTGSQAPPVGLQATPPAAQGTPACTQASPGRQQEQGCKEGSTTKAEMFAVKGNRGRQSTAADVSQEMADNDALHQVGFAMAPTTSLGSMSTVVVGLCVCVHVQALLSA